jgi:hypothetical protein
MIDVYCKVCLPFDFIDFFIVKMIFIHIISYIGYRVCDKTDFESDTYKGKRKS